ncbi:hypothetical protein GP486_006020 [Trichoglossum hirsutum]|uniref:Uncharacterized protein n=1 Tax=Trichoglossum hirsutum TaxID=265104 RepID=A0A9P8RL72_9PEZI|nr:hypothetical protein GP486_006020 [Trichoglossum hirsutum]
MTRYNSSDAAQSSPIAVQPLLDSMVPGFSILSQVFAQYFHIDITYYMTTFVIAMAVAAGLRIWGVILIDFFKGHFVSTAEIRFDDEMYNYVLYWVSNQAFSKKTCQFVAGTKTNSEMVWSPDEEEDDKYKDDDADLDLAEGYEDQWMRIANRDKIKTLQYTPSEGTHFFRYHGRFLAFTRVKEEKQTVIWVAQTERIYISCLGRDTQILKELLDEAQRAYLERDGNRTIIYRGCKQGGEETANWVRCMSRPPRPLSTVVLDETQKQAFVDDVKEYLHPWTRRWYSNRGIPYRRGYLLHGPPGTGKTSLCFAVSGMFGLKIHVVSLNSRTLTEDGLESLFHNLPRRCVVLLEDIDTAGVTEKREREESDKEKLVDKANGGTTGAAASPKGVSLSALLNIIDGVASSEGRILVMTTNHIEKLDNALLRPGRVDMTIGFGNADTATIGGLFRAIYTQLEGDIPTRQTETDESATEKPKAVPRDPEKSNGVVPTPKSATPSFFTENIHHHGLSDAEVTSLAAEFASAIPNEEFTPAEVQGYLLKHKSRPGVAVEGAAAWVEMLREEKAKRKEAEKKAMEEKRAKEEEEKQKNKKKQPEEKDGEGKKSERNEEGVEVTEEKGIKDGIVTSPGGTAPSSK